MANGLPDWLLLVFPRRFELLGRAGPGTNRLASTFFYAKNLKKLHAIQCATTRQNVFIEGTARKMFCGKLVRVTD